MVLLLELELELPHPPHRITKIAATTTKGRRGFTFNRRSFPLFVRAECVVSSSGLCGMQKKCAENVPNFKAQTI